MPARNAIRTTMVLAAIVSAGVAIGEGAARALGYHTPLLFERTERSFRVAPSQTGTIRGTAFSINAHGLRGSDVDAQPAPGTTRILVLGDVLVFAPHLPPEASLPARLQALLATRGMAAEVLNAGLPGADLATHAERARTGLLGAHVVVLQISFDDFHQPRTHELVGRHPMLPVATPALGLPRMLRAYTVERSGPPPWPDDSSAVMPTHQRIAEGGAHLRRIIAAVQQGGARVVVLWTASASERAAERPLADATRVMVRYVVSLAGVPMVDASPLTDVAMSAAHGLPSARAYESIAGPLVDAVTVSAKR